MEQNLVYIDVASSIANFYNIKIEKSNKEYLVIVCSGKFGNKGTTTIAYKGKDYVVCKTEFWKRVNDKQAQNYRKVEDVTSKIEAIFREEKKEYCCDICKKELNKRLYDKINIYLRNETEVDNDKNHSLYNKVACFDCQKKVGVYKGKKTEKTTE